MNSFILPSS